MLQKNKFYIISFTEGASVMAAEICGAKLLAPFFGSSLYVWSSVMAVTLGGLAGGYFFGGKLSKKSNKENNLLYILIAAVCCLCLMPFLSYFFYVIPSHVSLIPSVILSVFILLFPTMLCMGATSPLIISLLTHEVNQSGENSGKIYAISTVGGILATFLCGFYLIPNYGIMLTLICFAAALGLASLFIIAKKKSKSFLITFLISIAFALYSFSKSHVNKYTIYKTEGILGKLEIREEPLFPNTSNTIRKLVINNIVQTEMDIESKRSVSEYVQLLEHNMHYFQKGKALVLGLGGGVVANNVSNLNYEVTAVEFDARIIQMAKQFFYLHKTIKTICDDARHYINKSNERFNLVLFDVFRAEEQPSHIITKESLVKLKTILDTNAVVLINTHGYLTGQKGLGTQCLLATLKQSGFYLKACATGKNEDYRNLLIVVSLKPIQQKLHNEIIPLTFNSPFINTDNQPILEKLNASANQAWRNNYLHNYILLN